MDDNYDSTSFGKGSSSFNNPVRIQTKDVPSASIMYRPPQIQNACNHQDYQQSGQNPHRLKSLYIRKKNNDETIQRSMKLKELALNESQEIKVRETPITISRKFALEVGQVKNYQQELKKQQQVVSQYASPSKSSLPNIHGAYSMVQASTDKVKETIQINGQQQQQRIIARQYQSQSQQDLQRTNQSIMDKFERIYGLEHLNRLQIQQQLMQVKIDPNNLKQGLKFLKSKFKKKSNICKMNEQLLQKEESSQEIIRNLELLKIHYKFENIKNIEQKKLMTFTIRQQVANQCGDNIVKNYLSQDSFNPLNYNNIGIHQPKQKASLQKLKLETEDNQTFNKDYYVWLKDYQQEEALEIQPEEEQQLQNLGTVQKQAIEKLHQYRNKSEYFEDFIDYMDKQVQQLDPEELQNIRKKKQRMSKRYSTKLLMSFNKNYSSSKRGSLLLPTINQDGNNENEGSQGEGSEDEQNKDDKNVVKHLNQMSEPRKPCFSEMFHLIGQECQREKRNARQLKKIANKNKKKMNTNFNKLDRKFYNIVI